MQKSVCGKCGESNAYDAVVCKKCGSRIEKRETKLDSMLREGTLWDKIMRGPRRLMKKAFRFTRTLILGTLFTIITAIITLVVLLVVPIGWDTPVMPTKDDVQAGAKIDKDGMQIPEGKTGSISSDELRSLGLYLLLTDSRAKARDYTPLGHEDLLLMTPRPIERGMRYAAAKRLFAGATFSLIAEQKNDDSFVYTFCGELQKPKLPWRFRVTYFPDRENGGKLALTGLMFQNMPLPKSKLPQMLKLFEALLGPQRKISDFIDRIEGANMVMTPGQTSRLTLTLTKEQKKP